MNKPEIENLLTKMTVGMDERKREAIRKEVFKDFQEPTIFLTHKGKEFSLTLHTKRSKKIQGVQFSPIAIDVFDCCLGYLVSEPNHASMKKSGIDIKALKERYDLQVDWLKIQNPKYIIVLEKEFRDSERKKYL